MKITSFKANLFWVSIHNAIEAAKQNLFYLSLNPVEWMELLLYKCA